MRYVVVISVLFSFIGIHQVVAQEISRTEIQKQLIKDVTFLAHDSLEGRAIGSKGELIAAKYIAQRFEELGLSPKGTGDTSYFQIFTKKQQLHPHDTEFLGEKLTGRNVVGFVDRKAKNTIVIGAHYDHLGWGDENSLSEEKAIHNGADDNASGVAALLSIAEQLKGISLGNNILFIAFSGEEKGLLGSNFFVKNSTVDVASFNYMINMDMVGRLDENRRLAIYGVGTSPSFIPSLNTIDNPSFQFKMDSSGVGPSDHTSFYFENVPVLHFFTGQHAQYHKPEDDVELINFDGLTDVSVFISKLINKLEPESRLVFNKTGEPEEVKRSFKVTLGIMPDYLFTGKGLMISGVKENRPGAIGGLLKGDIIIKMGGEDINSMSDYMQALNMFSPGEEIKVVVDRGGKKTTKKIML